MAIGECPECKKPVSTGATTCPHCGYKIPRSRGCLVASLAVVTVVCTLIVIGSITKSPSPPADKQPAGPPRCDADNARQVVQQAVTAGIVHRVTTGGEVSRVYVLEPWNQLTLDAKKALDTVVQCDVTNGMPKGPTIVVYHDARNDKKLARSSPYGFELL